MLCANLFPRPPRDECADVSSAHARDVTNIIGGRIELESYQYEQVPNLTQFFCKFWFHMSPKSVLGGPRL